ncbi:outer membrane receptor protein involved in Fe transport [Dyadobacter jejuensis]|uniref:Outer membrane receptor protein involved in Fe transport n=1 Tax=Dyadobacter jejuensis TaxID=1082580 RepID=A0A316AMP8_9BACT|nr:TonB-dependent receptor [Dyadobacter jejuensis]PWJ58812.1 outer membrane receptor protein involved in Fe transport [Dyadobacter jejuensis]
MKKSILFPLLFLLSFSIFAQNRTTLKGRVIDQQDQSPLPFASVAIFLSGDSTLVNGTLSDSLGYFQIERVPKGSYYLEVNYIGYLSHRSTTILLNGTSPNMELPALQIEPSTVRLNSIVIQGQKELITNKIDRQVFQANQFLGSQGGTALDVIRNTPSVSINAEGQISLRGSSGFLVLINGRPVLTDASTILSQLPANAIENVEIISSPSASNDPDGKAGIINIQTKQSTKDDLSIMANIQGGLPSVKTYDNLRNPQRYGADVTMNFRNKKWDISVGGNFLRNDLTGRRVGDVNTTIDGVFTSFPSVGERSFKKYSYTARGQASYSINTKNTITGGFYHGYRSQARRADIVYNNTKTLLSTGENVGQIDYFNSNIADKSSRITLGNLDYTLTLSSKSSLKLSGLLEHADLQGLTTNRNIAEPSRSELLQYTENPSSNPLTAYRAKADYSLKVGSGKLETGYQFRHQLQKGNFTYLQQNLSDGSFVVIPEFSSSTRVSNDIHAVYGQYSSKFNKLEYVAGLRYEYAKRVFEADGITPRHLNLSNLFPSVNLQYSLTEQLIAKASYNKRIQRSTNNELNPYPEREHSETLEQGDPDILPEMIDQVELGIVKNYDKGNVFLTSYYQGVNNVVNRVNQVYNDTILNRIYTNAGKATKWGLEMGTSTKISKWWQIYAGGNLYHYQIKGSLFNDQVKVNTSSWVYSINANTTFQPTNSVTIQAGVNYLSKRITAQGEDSRFVLPNLSVRKTFMEGKLVANLQWQNIDMGLFGTNQQRITTSGTNFFTTTNYIQETDIFMINLSFNLNSLGKKANLPSSEFGDREF